MCLSWFRPVGPQTVYTWWHEGLRQLSSNTFSETVFLMYFQLLLLFFRVVWVMIDSWAQCVTGHIQRFTVGGRVRFTCCWAASLPGSRFPSCLLLSVLEMSEVFFPAALTLGRTLLKFPSRIHSCWSPSSGVIRLVGSQLQTRENKSSLQVRLVIQSYLNSKHMFSICWICFHDFLHEAAFDEG